MCKKMVVYKLLGRVLCLLLVMSFVAEPVYALDSRTILMLRNGDSNADTKNSFRGKDLKERLSGGESDENDIMQRGMLMTQPSMAGLSYQVHVLGEVNTPGTFRCLASERLAEVLNRAGGIADQGSKRKIEIKRDGKIVKRVDLIKFQMYGQLDNNPYLLDNDVVFIPLKNNTVQVVGAVKRPDVYEIVGEKNAMAVINLAGGFGSDTFQSEPVRVIRFVNGEKTVEEINNNKSSLTSFSIQDGDVLYVPSVVTAGHKFDYDVAKIPGGNVFYPSYEDRVFVLGGVQSPGAYPFSPYYNTHQYISLAGGYTQLSTRKMKIISPEGKKRRVDAKKELKVNPGDTILVGQRRIPPEGWVGLFMGLSSFGLSTTATVLALTR